MNKTNNNLHKLGVYPHYPIVLINNQKDIYETAKSILLSEGITHFVQWEGDNPETVLNRLTLFKISVLILDFDADCLQSDLFFEQLYERCVHIPIVLMVTMESLQNVLQYMITKAYDYILKPIDAHRLIIAVRRAIEYKEMKHQLFQLKQHMISNDIQHFEIFKNIHTQNKIMFGIFQYIEAIVRSPFTILLSGEPGVGKKRLAKIIHQLSGQKGQFVIINAKDLDESNYEKKLFGTNLSNQSDYGLIEMANHGTLCIRNIDCLSPKIQADVLQLFQEKKYIPYGESHPIYIDIRMIALTTQDLLRLSQKGHFRYDLYYFLNTHHLQVPSLRDRFDDLPLLTTHFVQTFTQTDAREILQDLDQLIGYLKKYTFPNNIKELKQLLFRALFASNFQCLNRDVIRDYIEPNTKKDHPSVFQWFSSLKSILFKQRL